MNPIAGEKGVALVVKRGGGEGEALEEVKLDRIVRQ